MNKVAYFIIILAVGVFLVVNLRNCVKDNRTTTSSTINDSFFLKEARQTIILNKYKDSLYSLRERLDSLNSRQAITDKQLDKSQNDIKSLIKEARNAREKRDTPTYYAVTDSLISKVDSLQEIIHVYRFQTDSLKSIISEIDTSTDKIFESQQKLYADLRSSYTALQTSYNDQVTENLKLNIKLKNQRNINKVVSIIATVGIGTLLITKK
jgi:hypothetical protein